MFKSNRTQVRLFTSPSGDQLTTRGQQRPQWLTSLARVHLPQHLAYVSHKWCNHSSHTHLVDVLKRARRPPLDTSTMPYKVTKPHTMTWHSANTWTWDGHLVRFAVFTKK